MRLRHHLDGRVSTARVSNGGGMVCADEWGPYDPRARVLELRRDGLSVRVISEQTGIPRATVGDWIRLEHNSRPDPMPYYLLVDY